MITSCYDLLRDDAGFPVLLLTHSERETLNNPEKVCYFLKKIFKADRLAEECAWVIANDVQCNGIAVFLISKGSWSYCFIGIKELFTRLLLVGADCFTVVHNHPSGSTAPSDADHAVCKRLIEVGKLLDFELLDFIILGKRVYSFQEEGILDRGDFSD